MNDKENVTIGRPKEGGAIFFAPAGTTLPTSASEELSEAFVCLGYVTEDGVTESVSEEGDDIVAWGPEDVMHSQTSYGKTLTLNLLETAKPAVLQFVYGKDNVTVNGDGSLKWRDTGKILPRGVFIVDTLHNNGSDNPRVHRKVYGDCQFVDRSGDHTYNNSDPLSFPVVMKAYKFTDSDGVKDYSIDYMTAATETSSES